MSSADADAFRRRMGLISVMATAVGTGIGPWLALFGGTPLSVDGRSLGLVIVAVVWGVAWAVIAQMIASLILVITAITTAVQRVLAPARHKTRRQPRNRAGARTLPTAADDRNKR
jgi:hypothetical protein